MIIAGKEYGSGSSRDWAAKGVMLLGVKAVIAESFERIHRTNLVGMGVLPLAVRAGRKCGFAEAKWQGIIPYHRRAEGGRDGIARQRDGGECGSEGNLF